MKAPHYEVAILHAILTEGAGAEVFSKVDASDFSPTYREFFSLASSLFDRGLTPDFVSVMDEAERAGFSGFGDLANDIASSHLPRNVGDYCKELKRLSVSRKLKDLAVQINHWAANEDPDTAYELAIAAVMELKVQDDDESLMSMNEMLKGTLEAIQSEFDSDGEFSGLATGYKDLDERWSGLKPHNLIYIAGRPAMGKTSLALNIAENAASNGKSVVFFSMEMSHDELTRKCLSSMGRVSFTRLTKASLREVDWPKLTAGYSRLKDKNMFVDDRGGLTVAQIRGRCYQIQKKCGLDLVVIDYLQLMRGPGQSRENEIGGISRSLKELAKEMDCPVIVISQLNRQCEQRPNKRPILSDLRDSGSLEQDANIVAFVYRDDVYNEDSSIKGVAEIITRKFRGGKIGTDCMEWKGDMQRFDDLEHRPDVESIIDDQESGGARKARAF